MCSNLLKYGFYIRFKILIEFITFISFFIKTQFNIYLEPYLILNKILAQYKMCIQAGYCSLQEGKINCVIQAARSMHARSLAPLALSYLHKKYFASFYERKQSGYTLLLGQNYFLQMLFCSTLIYVHPPLNCYSNAQNPLT